MTFHSEVPTFRTGFSLVEILLSLLILSGTLVTIMSGIQVSHDLTKQASFEETAAFFAEREMEILKSDLLEGRTKPLQGTSTGRFRLPAGWTAHLAWNSPDQLGIVKIACHIFQAGRDIGIESFLYVPQLAAVEGKRP